jgi:hypothetical protein
MTAPSFDTWTEGDAYPVIQTANTGDFASWVEGDAYPVLQLSEANVNVVALSRDFTIPAEWSGATAIARPAMLPIEWLGAVARHALIPAEWTRRYDRNARLPFEILGALARGAVIPYENSGFTALARAFKIPYENSGFIALAHDFNVPAEWMGRDATALSRAFKIPYEYAGGDPDVLPLSWNVIVLLDQPLLLQWLVHVYPDTFLLPLSWTVYEPLAALSLRWGSGPSIFTLFGLTPQNSGNPGQAL